MKIRGKEIKGPNFEYVVIPRGNGEDIVFKCKAVMDIQQYTKMYPVPDAPKVRHKSGELKADQTDVGYQLALTEYYERRYDWLVLKSLEDSEIEWTQVNIEDPNSWRFWKEEMKDAGFNDAEIDRVIRGMLVANSLDEQRMDEARARFLAGQAVQPANS